MTRKASLVSPPILLFVWDQKLTNKGTLDVKSRRAREPPRSTFSAWSLDTICLEQASSLPRKEEGTQPSVIRKGAVLASIAEVSVLAVTAVIVLCGGTGTHSSHRATAHDHEQQPMIMRRVNIII